jgi:RHS repeat-associated protein
MQVTYDAAGRSATVTDNGVNWTFAYDADGRVVSACKATVCTGSIDRVDYLYDGSGHRIQIKETTSGGTVTTTDLRYQGDTVVQEFVGGTVSRTYATDDTGRIVEVCDPDCSSGTIYVVVYNGHGDATGLWKQETSGAVTLANSYTYSTWGNPTTTVNSGAGFSDLKLRFLYVGASDVQWDSSFGLNLAYMHARHYSPALGRFIQPDPSGAEENLYGYAINSPLTKTDPSGEMTLPYLPPWILGRTFELYVATILREGGWRIVDVRHMQLEGLRFVDIKAIRNGELANFEAKFGNSYYGGRQLLIDLELEEMGLGRAYVVRGRMVEGYMFRVEIHEVGTGRNVTGRVLRVGTPGGRGAFGERVNGHGGGGQRKYL